MWVEWRLGSETLSLNSPRAIMDTRIFALTLFLLLFYKPVELHRVVPIFFVDLLIKINIPQFPSPYVLVTMVDYVPVTKFNSLKKKTHCCFASYIYMPLYANMHGICLSYKWSYYGLPNLRPVPFRTLRSRLHLRHVRHLLCSDLFLTVYPPVVGNLLGKISPALQPNSERFQQGSRTVPDFRGVHFRVTSTQPQRLKPNRFAVGNMGKWCKMTNLLPFTAKLRSVDHSVVPGRLRMGKQWFTNGWNGVTRLPDFSDRDMISEIRENHHRSNSDSYRECQKNGVWIPSGNVTSLHGKLMIQPLLKGIVMSHENTKFLMISCAIPIHVYVYIYMCVCHMYVYTYIYIHM